jgi:hypothetical protein
MTITIELELEDYIDMLENKRAERAALLDMTIPNSVWNGFIEMLGYGMVPENADPTYIVDNMSVNGDYMVIEDSDLLGKAFSIAIRLFKDENCESLTYDILSRANEMSSLNEWISGRYEKELKKLIYSRREDIMDELQDDVLFTYLDDSSEYGIGVCYRL